MPWTFPSLRQRRQQVRDHIVAHLPGADATLPNSVLRVLADAKGGLAHSLDLFHDWLARQIMVDTAEREHLDRHAIIWLADGRKAAAFATGTVEFTGAAGIEIPAATRLAAGNGVELETDAAITLSDGPTPVAVTALDPGVAGNLETGSRLSLVAAIAGVDSTATVAAPGLAGGVDEEDDDSLRDRVLDRIQAPPHGGSFNDYVQWAREVEGVTRAWAAPLEMGMGTVTVRFMMDELRAAEGGFPTAEDVAAVRAHLDAVRPVAVKDFFVVAPQPQPVDLAIANLVRDDAATRGAIEAALKAMIADRAAPGQTIYRSWVAEAVAGAAGEDRHDLTFDNAAMPTANHLPVLGSIAYG